MSFLFFTACKKDSITPTTQINQENTPTVNNTDPNSISQATQTRAMAAATVASARNNNNSTPDDCGCYAIFEGIDMDAPYEEVAAAVDSILATLTEEEITRLFEPVCTDDGEIFESACIADCEGITGYRVCSEEELEDYFFGDFGCNNLEDLTFPTELELPDGTTVTVNNEEELFEVLEAWYDAHGEDYEDEDYEDDFEACFSIVFPVQVQFPDGSIISYDNEEDLYTSIEAWYDLNADSEEDPLPVFPLEVMLEDSSIVAVNSEEELDQIWESCFEGDEFDLCFEINFPITLVFPDGTTTEVNSEDEIEETVDTFYENNPDTEADIEVQFPISITLTDGTEQAINSELELEEALFSCFEDEGDGVGRLAPRSKYSIFSTKSAIEQAVFRTGRL